VRTSAEDATAAAGAGPAVRTNVGLRLRTTSVLVVVPVRTRGRSLLADAFAGLADDVGLREPGPFGAGFGRPHPAQPPRRWTVTAVSCTNRVRAGFRTPS
jgi:hypothetical protein